MKTYSHSHCFVLGLLLAIPSYSCAELVYKSAAELDSPKFMRMLSEKAWHSTQSTFSPATPDIQILGACSDDSRPQQEYIAYVARRKAPSLGFVNGSFSNYYDLIVTISPEYRQSHSIIQARLLALVMPALREGGLKEGVSGIAIPYDSAVDSTTAGKYKEMNELYQDFLPLPHFAAARLQEVSNTMSNSDGDKNGAQFFPFLLSIDFHSAQFEAAVERLQGGNDGTKASGGVVNTLMV